MVKTVPQPQTKYVFNQSSCTLMPLLYLACLQTDATINPVTCIDMNKCLCLWLLVLCHQVDDCAQSSTW